MLTQGCTNTLCLSESSAVLQFTNLPIYQFYCCRTNFFQTALRNTFAGYHVNTQLSGGARAGGGPRWPYKPSTALRRQHWAAAPIAILIDCEALSLAAFLVDKVLRSHSSYRDDSLDAHQYMHGEWWSPCMYRRNHNDSSPLRLWLCRTFRRYSEGASARKGGSSWPPPNITPRRYHCLPRCASYHVPVPLRTTLPRST